MSGEVNWRDVHVVRFGYNNCCENEVADVGGSISSRGVEVSRRCYTRAIGGASGNARIVRGQSE